MPALQFSKLGKSVGDLFKKEYDYQYQVATKNKAGAVAVESGAFGKSGGLNGYGKLTYTDKSFGKVEMEMRTNDKPDKTNVKVTLDKLSDGLEVVLAGDAASSASVEASYSQDFFSSNVKLSSAGGQQSASVSGLISSDGLSVGGNLSFDLGAEGSPTLKDYNVGSEYSEKDFTLSLVTKSQGEEIHASYFQRMNKDTQIGCTFSHNPDGDKRTLTFGGQRQLDASTTVKSMANTDGALAVAVVHQLGNPAFSVGVSSKFNALSKDPLVAQAFGVSLKFGDF